MKKRIAAFLLVLCLAGTACFAAAEQAGITGPVQWKGYELAVDSVRTGSGKELDDLSMRGSKYMEENSPNLTDITETLLEIRLLGGEDGVKLEDVLDAENKSLFVLTDAAGQEIPLFCFSWWGVGFDPATGFGSYDPQEGFLLYYDLPDGVSAEDLTLSVREE